MAGFRINRELYRLAPGLVTAISCSRHYLLSYEIVVVGRQALSSGLVEFHSQGRHSSAENQVRTAETVYA
jgi:hypothetical protein